MTEERRRIYLGGDHAGFALRRRLGAHLREGGHQVEDLGSASAEPTDYPDFAAQVGRAVRDQPGSYGVLACGSGMGVCLAANKVRGVRAVAPWNVEMAKLAAAHNDANVLCLGARFLPEHEAFHIVDAWLSTPFEGGRHARRLAKVAAIEQEEQKR